MNKRHHTSRIAKTIQSYFQERFQYSWGGWCFIVNMRPWLVTILREGTFVRDNNRTRIIKNNEYDWVIVVYNWEPVIIAVMLFQHNWHLMTVTWKLLFLGFCMRNGGRHGTFRRQRKQLICGLGICSNTIMNAILILYSGNSFATLKSHPYTTTKINLW